MASHVARLFFCSAFFVFLLDAREEQDRGLLENSDSINAKILSGIDQLDRREGIPEDQLDAHLAKLKSKTK